MKVKLFWKLLLLYDRIDLVTYFRTIVIFIDMGPLEE